MSALERLVQAKSSTKNYYEVRKTEATARALTSVFGAMTVEQARGIEAGRRDLVRALERLAWVIPAATGRCLEGKIN